jgi:hypothetical protein
MPTTTERKMLVVASALAVGALGLLATPCAYAAPACEVYGFAGDVRITGNGAITELNFAADGTSAHGSATASGDKGGVMNGTIAGGIVENGPRMHLTFIPDAGGGPFVLTGSIRENDLVATGTQVGGTWSTTAPLACLQERSSKPGAYMFQLSEDTDMYDGPSGTGKKLPGFAEGGEGAPLVKLVECRDDNWCQIEVSPGKLVWVWGGAVPEYARP